jgi:lipopolysaccharide transport protein LptA
MAVFNAKTLSLIAHALALALAPALAPAVLTSSRVGGALAAQPRPEAQTIALDAQSAEVDLANNNVVFRKVRIAQGDMSISADQGQGTKQTTRLDFENSLWIFRGAVKITMTDGQLTSDDAQINFAKQVLSKAVVNGKPAAFEQRVAKNGKAAHGRADTIDYDAGKGVVHLAKNAWLSDGTTEIRGESLKYNLLAQSIVADSSEQGSQRVHIIITPPPSKP